MTSTNSSHVPSGDPVTSVHADQANTLGQVPSLHETARYRRSGEAMTQFATRSESSDDAIISISPDSKIVSWNPGAERLYGYTSAEAIGKPIAVLVPLEQQAPLEARLADIRQGNKSARLEANHRRKDGRLVSVELTLSPLIGEAYATAIVAMIARDVSQLRRAEMAQQFLAEASTRLASSLDYQVTLESIAQLAVPRLADLCVIYALEEDGSIRRLALEHVDAAQREWASKVPDEFIRDPNAKVGVPQVLRTGAAVLDRFILLTQLELDVYSAGRLRDFIRSLRLQSWICVPLAVHGRTFGAISFLSTTAGHYYDEADLAVSQEFALRAALALDNARLYQEAQLAIQTRDQFLSLASHELKTPLTALLGYSELLEQRFANDTLLDEQDRRALQSIFKQGERLNKLVSALLDISRIETGKLSIERSPVELGRLVARIVEEVEPTLRQHTIQLNRPARPVVISGDELRLEQVLLNLIQNAIKYSPHGGAVCVKVERRAEVGIISVTDEGIGIPARELSQLFGRFYRARNAMNLHISGMGLGLFIIREIIHLHGGEVSVESQEGRGSTFTISLPLASQAIETMQSGTRH